MAVTRRTLAYGLTANVVVLGVVSLFTDISSEMILPILPFFLTQVLLANALILGLVEGLSESVVSFMKIFSGRLSDAAGKRKRFVATGYGLSTAMKVLFPFAGSWPEFLGMRVLERTGKGIRDAPRDALLTESTPAETRGKAFGFHRSMDTSGAIAGPIVTLVLLTTVGAAMTVEGSYRMILFLAAIPAVISVLIVMFVKEPAREPSPAKPLRITFRGIPRPLLVFIGIASLFSLADFSYAFLLLRAVQQSATQQAIVQAILLYVLFNIVYAANAFPAGILSDRVGRKPVVLVGYVLFVAMAVLLAVSVELIVLIVMFVKEPTREPSPPKPLRVTFRGVPRPLLVFIGIASLFSLADFSYAFLLLRAVPQSGTQQAIVQAILLYVLFNIVYAANAFPAGILSDRVGRKPVVLVGYVLFVAMAVLLAVSTELIVLIVGFVLYGLAYGMAEGTQRALVADFAPPEIKATVLGAYHTSVGVVKLASGLVAGFLWVAVSPSATFAFGAVLASASAVALSLWHPTVTS